MLGSPFVGKAGALLTYILGRLGIKESLIYITNAVKCRPPNNQLPTRKAERTNILEACWEYLHQEIQSVNPRVIVALGATPLEVLTGNAQVSAHAGWMVPTNKVRPVVVAAYHPAFVLRQPSNEWRLAAAIQRACALAGLKTVATATNKWYEYDN